MAEPLRPSSRDGSEVHGRARSPAAKVNILTFESGRKTKNCIFSGRPLDHLHPAAASVSLVVVCFNNAPFIAEAIESALAQSQLPREIIVIDNGSTDGSAEILTRYAAQKPLIQVRFLTSNDGPGIARNHGLASATGDYVMFLDGDDLLEPNAIATAVSAAAAEEADIVQFAYRRCGEDSAACQSAPRAAEAGDADAARLAMLRGSPAVWTRLYRRDLLARVNEPFKPGIYEDIPWSAKYILEARKPVIISAPLVRHRVYRHSTIKSRHAAHGDFAEALNELVGVMRTSLPAHWDRREVGEIAIYRVRKFLPNVLLRTGVRNWLGITVRLNRVLADLAEPELSGVSPLLTGRPDWRARFGRMLFWQDNGWRALARGACKLLQGARDSNRLPAARNDLAERSTPHL